MEWMKITGPQFKKYVAAGNRVAVIPCGSIEKHGEHLPLGTDTLDIEYICRAACEKADAIMLPPLVYMNVNEMKASAGAVALNVQTIFTVLREVCDEVARNGIKKIVLANGHGGNKALLRSFYQDTPGKGRDYAVYVTFFSELIQGPKAEKARAMKKATALDAHAGDGETDLVLHTYPELVDKSAISQNEADGLTVLNFDVSPSEPHIFWYAEYPNSLAGDPRFLQPERGKLMAEAAIDTMAGMLGRIRDDKNVLDTAARFEAEARDPKKMR